MWETYQWEKTLQFTLCTQAGNNSRRWEWYTYVIQNTRGQQREWEHVKAKYVVVENI